jgi:hypothetical protein
LKFYKSFKGIKVISPILPFDLTTNANKGRTFYQIRSSIGKIKSFLTLRKSFQNE